MENMLILAAWDLAFFKAVFLCALALGLIIFIHELGHFLVAKACGVRCDKFYIGFDFFGLKLLHFKYGETEYGIGVFPLGGYVKMLGQEDNPGETRERIAKAKEAQEKLAKYREALQNGQLPGEIPGEILEDGSRESLTEEEIADAEKRILAEIEEAEKLVNDPRSYQAKTVPQRLAIIVAGVTMNVILAFLAAVAAFMFGTFKVPCEIGHVHPGQAAWEAGLQPGDRILQIGENEITYFEEIQKNVALGNLGEGLYIRYQRNGEIPEAVKASPKKYALAPMLGASASVVPVLGASPVIPASPTFLTDRELKKGDILAGVNGREIRSNLEAQKALYAVTGENMTLKFLRPSAEAQEKRFAELKKLKVDDEAQRTLIEEEYRKGAEAFEVVVEPMKARHLGIVLTMGPIQCIREGESSLEGAGRAGLKPGDQITGFEVTVDGKAQMVRELDPVKLPFMVQQEAKLRAEAGVPTLNFAVLKKESGSEEVVPVEFSLDVFSADQYFFGSGEVLPEIGLTYEILPKVASVMPGSEAEKNGVKPGFIMGSMKLKFEEPKNVESSEKDKKTAEFFDGKQPTHIFRDGVCSWPMVYHGMILLWPKFSSSVEVVFNDPETGTSKTVDLPIQEYEDTCVYHLDLNFEARRIFIQESFGSAVVSGAKETGNALTMVYQMLGKLFSGQVSVKGLGGPVLIAQAAYSSAKEGLAPLLMFICLISANLAVLNLLPIPVLDGGHVVFLLWEGITGKEPNENLVIILSYMGLLLFLGLTIFVLGLDLGFIPRF
ncbi:MAG: site-2 protease family protein [Thermoguttaceae bacterium]|nr:site-2 protease family protein [Thermoguttaceae bacterium]